MKNPGLFLVRLVDVSFLKPLVTSKNQYIIKLYSDYQENKIEQGEVVVMSIQFEVKFKNRHDSSRMYIYISP